MTELLRLGGGGCQICGYNKCSSGLHFHHRDPNLKSFGLKISNMTYSWERLVEEMEKCILLCGNCHAEVHEGLHDE